MANIGDIEYMLKWLDAPPALTPENVTITMTHKDGEPGCYFENENYSVWATLDQINTAATDRNLY